MKVLIYFLCFFVLAIIQMGISYSGIILGGIPTAILFGLAIFCAQLLCKEYDKSKAEREIDHISSDDPAGTITSTSDISSDECPEESDKETLPRSVPVVTIPAAENSTINSKSDHTKQRYCKLCGGTIDPATKKCDKCGKQYFRWKYFGRISAISLNVLTIIALITVIVYQNVEYQKTISELNDTIASLTSTVESQEAELSKRSSTILSKLKEIREMDQKLSSLQAEIRFYDKHVVFVPDDGNRTYHMYECYYFRTSDESFWAYNTEQAIYRGFSPCKYCCSE